MLTKPNFYTPEPVVNYNAMMRYIDDKYKIHNRDYHKTYSKENSDYQNYMDFWHWIIDFYQEQIHDGCTITLWIREWLEDENLPNWIKEIVQLIYDEYQKDEMAVYISW